MPQRFAIVTALPDDPEGEKVLLYREHRKHADSVFETAIRVFPGYIVRMYDYLAKSRDIPVRVHDPKES
jgi:hypothetical protein